MVLKFSSLAWMQLNENSVHVTEWVRRAGEAVKPYRGQPHSRCGALTGTRI